VGRGIRVFDTDNVKYEILLKTYLSDTVIIDIRYINIILRIDAQTPGIPELGTGPIAIGIPLRAARNRQQLFSLWAVYCRHSRLYDIRPRPS